jgi:hypothetical protein
MSFKGRIAIVVGGASLDLLAVNLEPKNEAVQILAFTWRKGDVKRVRALLYVGKTADNQAFIQYLFHFNHVFAGKR